MVQLLNPNIQFESEEEIKEFLQLYLYSGSMVRKVFFSDTPHCNLGLTFDLRWLY